MQRTLFDDTHERSATRSARSSTRRPCPHRDEWEAAGIVDRELFRTAGANGFLGMDVPEEYGGGGVKDFRFNLVIAEEIQRADVNAAGLGIDAAQRHLPAVLPAPDERRAEAAVAARHLLPAS